MREHLGKLIISLSVCQFAGIVGAFLNDAPIREWYITLDKPSFNPPNWIFGPVWITLYLMMGVALFLVWTSDVPQRAKKIAMIIFFIQLALNILWNFLFFYLRSPFLGLIEIVILVVLIALTIWKFFPIRPLAGYLLVPYFLWICFAAVLNYSLWNLNR
ncbi:MAG: tryptophan-rich sensory protein [bacterium]|nr:tryptophan-rich sensory protein [bacterium]